MDSEFIHDDYALEPRGLNWQPFSEYGFASPWAPRLWRTSIGANYLISTLIALFIATGFAMASDRCQHRCLIPLMLCGILAGSDIVAWLRKEIDAFDIKALVAGFLYLNCFVAPLFHLYYDTYGERITSPNWPAYFGYMGYFNAIGIILLKLSHNFLFKRSRPVKGFWQVEPTRFVLVLIPILIVSIAASLVIRFFFGGLIRREGVILFAGGSAAYAHHLSWIMMLGDSLFLLMAMAVIYWMSKSDRGKPPRLWTVLFILLSFVVLQFLLVGLRGSRMVTLSMVFIVAAIFHYRLRQFSVKFILASICMVFIFVYLYSFYKHLGPRGWAAFYSAEARKRMQAERALTPLATLLGSFARADVQASMLYRLGEMGDSFQRLDGRSYAMAFLTFVPRAIWKTKPLKSPKVRAGGEILGYYGLEDSSRQYGLAGEAMLNFGYYGILPAFFIFGSVLGWFRKKIATMEPSDSRFFLVPVLLITFGLAINTDSDNLVFNLLKIGVLPLVVVFLGSIKSRLGPMKESD